LHESPLGHLEVKSMRLLRTTVVSVLVFLVLSPLAHAQYFGKNKVQWEKFDFKTLRTEHFDIYYYDQEADVVNDVGRMAERWYARLSRVFNHSFTRKPIVLYANAADFQQTTTTTELIGQGTGGFTDPFMNRVVLPLTGDYAENDHVLGHEMVHVFQFDVASTMNNNRRRFNLEQMPLWIVEGMAEYFSKGRIDPLTSMWVRDATVHNRLPDIRQLTRDPRFFPYRYGQSVMAYIGGRFGDEAVIRYFLAAGMNGIESGVDRALGISAKQLFTDWRESSRELYNPVVIDRPATTSKPLIGAERGQRGSLNVGPAYSPDGRYIAFLSTREIFDIDLFLADAHTGQVIRRLVSSDRDAHFEALRFIDSAGTWSPDSRRLAFVVFEKGDNFLGVVDVESRKIDHIRVPGLDAINNVAWSPDGQTIAIAGQTSGVSDLFTYNLETKAVRRLTNDKFADLQPSWSPDGRTIVFVSDRGTNTVLQNLAFGEMAVSTIDVQSGSVTTLPLFQNARHINPQYSPDGRSLYFVSNPEGVPDVFRYTFDGGRIERLTHVQTGVAGITDMSPALAVASRTGDIAFSMYEDDNYNIYKIAAPQTGSAVSTTTVADAPRAAQLPPLRGTGSTITDYLNQPAAGLPPENARFQETGYTPSLHLAYLGPPTLGAGVSSYGVGLGGSISAYFSDVLGYHNVGLAIEGGGSSGYGSIGDQIGAQLLYLNQRHRFNWGATASHLPYVTGFTSTGVGVSPGGVVSDVYQQRIDILRFDEASAIAQYPFSTTRRIEGSAGMQHQSQKSEVRTFYVIGDQIIDETRTNLGNDLSLTLGRASVAFVGDSSVFGFLSPVRGTRYRYEVESLTGDLKFQTALADWRKYWFMRPVTLAVRGLHYGRYGTDAENSLIYPLFLGNGDLVRGYDSSSINVARECVTPTGSICPVFDRLIGSKIAVASAEVRVPLFGTREFGIATGFLPTELAGFVDVGTAWNAGESPKLKYATNTNERVPVVSVGVAARILLAYIPLEFYYAKPFQRPDAGWQFGFNIIPGW
jgi:Tol biopolymer transport system component